MNRLRFRLLQFITCTMPRSRVVAFIDWMIALSVFALDGRAISGYPLENALLRLCDGMELGNGRHLDHAHLGDDDLP